MSASRTVPTGHLPTLIAAFLHFDLSFMLWVSLGALGIYIAEDLGLSPAEKGLMVAIPILSGSLLRIPFGYLSDRFGSKRVGVALLGILFIPLTLGWQAGDTLPQLLGIGLLLGTAGASFTVALPLASGWYSQERQGLVMGVAAAGNSGTVIANLLAPRLASVVGWHGVLGIAMLPLALVLIAFFVMAKDSPSRSQVRERTSYWTPLKQVDLWRFCLFYSVTFGGFVGMISFLPLFLRDQFSVSPVTAGYLTALAAVVGSGLRPLGGHLADRFGGVGVLSLLLAGISSIYALLSLLPPLPLLMSLVVAGMACLGMGNGAVFQLVPQRFAREIGIATGVIGALGGLGGFFLPNLLGTVKAMSGSFASGFFVLTVLALVAVLLLRGIVAAYPGWPIRRAPATAPARVMMVPYLET